MRSATVKHGRLPGGVHAEPGITLSRMPSLPGAVGIRPTRKTVSSQYQLSGPGSNAPRSIRTGFVSEALSPGANGPRPLLSLPRTREPVGSRPRFSLSSRDLPARSRVPPRRVARGSGRTLQRNLVKHDTVAPPLPQLVFSGAVCFRVSRWRDRGGNYERKIIT
jgi:hypothetical protein